MGANVLGRWAAGQTTVRPYWPIRDLSIDPRSGDWVTCLKLITPLGRHPLKGLAAPRARLLTSLHALTW